MPKLVREIKCKDSKGKPRIKIEAMCDCGSLFVCCKYAFKDGRVSSCGCARLGNGNAVKHGQFGSITYSSWSAMITRCTNPNYNNYKYYGEIGISVNKKWLVFEGFLEDMGERPSRDYCLSRIDHSKDYAPGNVVWGLKSDNSREVLRRCRSWES